ncbi:MAG TPA: hypothetical protein VIX89_11530 [Bryobacteraceae bacterium]
MNHFTRMAVVALALTLCAASQTHPDFSGAWILNSADSNYRANKPNMPDHFVRTVKQKGDKLSYKVETERNGKKGGFEVDLTIGGAGYESNAAGVVSAEWKGSSLVITTLFNPDSDHPSDQTETWVLSEDGNKVVDELEYRGKQGKALITRVFDKRR